MRTYVVETPNPILVAAGVEVASRTKERTTMAKTIKFRRPGSAVHSTAEHAVMAQVCSCGCAEPHVIMTRVTYDEVAVSIWSDGSLTTGRLGTYLPGLGTGRSNYARRTRAKAVRLIADDISLFTAAELPTAVKVAEKTYAHTYSSELDRRRYALAIARRKLDKARR